MKLLFTLFLGILFSQMLWAQENDKKYHVGVSFMPQVSTMVNGDHIGEGRPGFGFEFQPYLFKKVTNQIRIETGIKVQAGNLKQRYHELQWPSDVINGQWDRSRSHEQFEAQYFGLGLGAGINLNLNEKVNTLSVNFSANVRRVIHFRDKLIINESGHFTEIDEADLNNEVNKTQFLLSSGLNYEIELKNNTRFSIGPSIEYSLVDLLRNSSPNLLWSYGGGHPFFFGIRFSYAKT